MRHAIIYYGCDLPGRRAAAAALCGAAVVLQAYHPLVRSGQFADWFPGCSLFVYWNPTGVPAADLAAVPPGTRLLAPDPAWPLARLDPRCAAARQVAIRSGLLARQAGGPAAGLFIDDLDRWSGPDTGRPASGIAASEAALAVVAAVTAARGACARLFVNRGFALWPRLARLAPVAAVLLEELTPGLVDRMPAGDQEWVRQHVLPAVRQARAGGTACFSLGYEPPAAGPGRAGRAGPRGAAARELAELTDGVLHGTRSLDTWPEEFR